MLKTYRSSKGVCCLFGLILAGGFSQILSGQDMAIYTDSLQNSWENWSWSSTVDLNSTAYVHSGSKSASITMTAAWAGFSLHHADMNTSGYSDLSFWIHGGSSGGQLLQVFGELTSGGSPPAVTIPALTTGWQHITISLSSLGLANKTDLNRINIQDRSGAAQATFYVDDMVLVTNSSPGATVTLTSPANNATFAAPATVSLAASVTANGHTINRVEFYNGATLLNQDTTSPYSYSWTSVAAGNYSVKARVIYDGSASSDSATANITVTGSSAVTIVVDAQSAQHAISPMIYGTAFASATDLQDLNFIMNRSGGNSETRYNWLINAHNHAADWYFESIADSSSTPAAASDDFITASKTGGAQPLISIPMIGWMPKLGPSRGKLASFSIAKYGPQTGNDSSWMPDAGNGVSTYGTNIINDPNDANYLTNSAFEQAFVQHLTNRWGLSTNGGVAYYIMDNEHSIWHSTHRDVHPIGANMEEIRDKMFEYGGMVKSNDPNAYVLGPEEFGWSGYLYSGYDLWYGSLHGWSTFPDRAAHGNMDYMAWLLDQFRMHDQSIGKRILDYFTLHCYPEDSNVAGDATDTATQNLRSRLTRKFWDPTYVDETWINQPVDLIPRMKSWVNTYYPGTKIGITEYNWGAENHINGATAQADILGIFGREGLDLATRWTTPASTTPTYKAMKMYRNYDGNKSTFGDTSVYASAPDPNTLTAYAAVRSSDGALTLMVVNKSLTAGGTLTVNISNFSPTNQAQVWQLTAANTISHLANVSLSGNTLSATVPIQSITLFVVPAAPALTIPNPPVLRDGTMTGPTTLSLWLDGEAGRSYVIIGSTDLSTWTDVRTNTLSGTTTNLVINAPDPYRFYRAVWRAP